MKKTATPAERAWRKNYGWERYLENFWRAFGTPVALSPRAIASTRRHHRGVIQ